MPQKQDHKGQCHCGAVRFSARTDLSGLGDCNCSRCRRLGWVMQSVPEADFTLLAGEDALLTIRPRHYENRRVELTNRQMRAVFWTSTVALPLLALLTGLLLWWRRR